MADGHQELTAQDLAETGMSWQKMLWACYTAIFQSNGDQSLQRQARENKVATARHDLILNGPDGEPEKGIVSQVHALNDFTKVIKKLLWVFAAAAIAAIVNAGFNLHDHIMPAERAAAPVVYIQRESGTTTTDQNGVQSFSTTDSNSTQTVSPAKK